MKFLIERLREPTLAAVDVDGADRLSSHARMLARKPMLQAVFREFHELFDSLDKRYLSGDGTRVELGAGVAPMRDSYRDVLATDVVPSPALDRVLDAQHMDLPPRSVRAFFLQNCFHHFPDPDQFFRELDRVLQAGGGAVLIEPYHGPFASFLYKRLFTTEGFDKRAAAWTVEAHGPMNGANQALSYLVFVRDLRLFQQKHPSLEVVAMQPLGNYVKYLLSGGLNFRQLAPNWAMPAVNALEWVLLPLRRAFALHHVIVIRKKNG
jgi:SAM-dependent methyltransferase